MTRGTRFLVAGMVNWETNVPVEAFPLPYAPVHYHSFGITAHVSGVGCNIAAALQALGGQVTLLSVVGTDPVGTLIVASLRLRGLSVDHVLPVAQGSATSVILFAPDGQRQIEVDLKDIQSTIYPPAQAESLIRSCDIAVVTNINFNRPLLAQAKQLGKLVATDVHALHDLDDPYNQDFLAAADILFMSHERLPLPVPLWAAKVAERWQPRIIVIGMGAGGAYLAVPDEEIAIQMPAIAVRPIVNTIGAGDALFSSFLYHYSKGLSPIESLHRAQLFAGYKIGANGGAEGFPDTTTFAALCQRFPYIGSSKSIKDAD